MSSLQPRTQLDVTVDTRDRLSTQERTKPDPQTPFMVCIGATFTSLVGVNTFAGMLSTIWDTPCPIVASEFHARIDTASGSNVSANWRYAGTAKDTVTIATGDLYAVQKFTTKTVLEPNQPVYFEITAPGSNWSRISVWLVGWSAEPMSYWGTFITYDGGV